MIATRPSNLKHFKLIVKHKWLKNATRKIHKACQSIHYIFTTFQHLENRHCISASVKQPTILHYITNKVTFNKYHTVNSTPSCPSQNTNTNSNKMEINWIVNTSPVLPMGPILICLKGDQHPSPLPSIPKLLSIYLYSPS